MGSLQLFSIIAWRTICSMDLLPIFITGNVVLVALALCYVLYMSRNFRMFQNMGIPGPSPWPGLGNLPDVAREGMFRFHRRLYSQYSADKVYGYYDPGQPVLVIRDLDMVREVCVKNFSCFANHRILTKEAAFGHILPFIKDEQWKRVRNTVSPAFSSGNLKAMSAHIDRAVKDLLSVLKDASQDKREIELKDLMSCLTMDIIAGTGFGVKTHSLESRSNIFLREARYLIQSGIRMAVLTILFPFLMPLLNKLGIGVLPKRPLKFFAGFVDEALNAQQRQGLKVTRCNAFIQMISGAYHNDSKSSKPRHKNVDDEQTRTSLSYMEIQGQALAFILAGFDSVSTALSFTLFLLACHPDCCANVQDEIDRKLGTESPNYDNIQDLTYLDMCINESLRMYPPGVFQDRVCNQDCVIEGFSIPKNTMIVIPVVGIHYDPKFWPEPDKFDPSRFTTENKTRRHNYAFLPFGHGPRNCVGQRLAVLTIKMCLASVLKRLTPVACSRSVYPVTVSNFLMAAKDGLWVKVIERTQHNESAR